MGDADAERVEGVFPLAAIGDEIDLPQQGELRGDAGLTHAEDFLKFGDGELLARNEGEQTQSGRIGESFEDVPRSVHAGRRWGWSASPASRLVVVTIDRARSEGGLGSV